MANPVYILGAGGHALTVVDLLQECGHTVAGAFDDSRTGEVLGVAIIGRIEDFARHGSAQAVIAIGDNAARKRIAERVSGRGLGYHHFSRSAGPPKRSVWPGDVGLCRRSHSAPNCHRGSRHH